MLFSMMMVELWGLQSKQLRRTGPAPSWLLWAVSSQGLSISKDRDLTTSLGPCSHVWPLSLGKTKSECLPFCNSYPQPLISLPCTAEEASGSAFSTPSVRQLKAAVRTLLRVSFSPGSTECFPSASRKHTGVNQRLQEDHFFGLSPWLLFPSQAGKAGRSCHSLLTSGAWTSTDEKCKDSYCCCPIISLK